MFYPRFSFTKKEDFLPSVINFRPWNDPTQPQTVVCKLSWKTHILHTRFWNLGANLYALCLLTKFLHQSSVRFLIKSTLLVGQTTSCVMLRWYSQNYHRFLPHTFYIHSFCCCCFQHFCGSAWLEMNSWSGVRIANFFFETQMRQILGERCQFSVQYN